MTVCSPMKGTTHCRVFQGAPKGSISKIESDGADSSDVAAVSADTSRQLCLYRLVLTPKPGCVSTTSDGRIQVTNRRFSTRFQTEASSCANASPLRPATRD